jgi:hypothetical protein
MFIDALTKIRLPAMSAVDGSPSVPIVVRLVPGLLEPLLPQETVAATASPQATKLSFMDKIFCLTPTEGNR